MPTTAPYAPRSFLWPGLLGCGYLALAWASLVFTGGVDGIATMWPPSGLAVAALMLAPPAARPRLLVTIAIASLAANRLFGSSWPLTIGFSFANVTEAWLAALIAGRDRGSTAFIDFSAIWRFWLAALIAGLCSASIATCVAGGGGTMFLSWAGTVALGIMIVAPAVIMTARTIAAARWPRRRDVAIAAGLMAQVLVVSGVVFAQNAYPVLFLPMCAVLVATYWLGPLGATGSVLIIALVGTTATSFGYGPILFARGGAGATTLFLQFYLLTLLGSALPLAALLAQRDRMLAHITRGTRMLEMAERTAQVGHWHLDLTDRSLLWSAEVFRMHGLDPAAGVPSLEEAVDAYHADDRDRIEAALSHAVSALEPFDVDARLVRADGTVRHVNSRGEAERDADGNVIGVFGVIQDITARAESVLALEAARHAAEAAARHAATLAETDQLTGIANRRKALAVLDAAVSEARQSGRPLAAAIFDIDHFKAVNDTYGHAIGDKVLARAVRECRGALRDTDLVGRIGGEEFVIVLPGASPDIAVTVAERVRRAIEASAAPDLPPVTASIGVAAFRPGLDAADLIQLADDALYRAKSDGRNLLRMAA